MLCRIKEEIICSIGTAFQVNVFIRISPCYMLLSHDLSKHITDLQMLIARNNANNFTLNSKIYVNWYNKDVRWQTVW